MGGHKDGLKLPLQLSLPAVLSASQRQLKIWCMDWSGPGYPNTIPDMAKDLLISLSALAGINQALGLSLPFLGWNPVSLPFLAWFWATAIRVAQVTSSSHQVQTCSSFLWTAVTSGEYSDPGSLL